MRTLRVSLAIVLLSACAPSIVDHSFEFDALEDSPGVRILDHRYGESNFPGARNPVSRLSSDDPLQRISITGGMKRPASLYVKWRVLADNKVYEDTVDLRNRLPGDFSGCKVYFMVRGPQLYVYLVNPGRRPPDVPPNGPKLYRDHLVFTLYPGQPKVSEFPSCEWKPPRR